MATSCSRVRSSSCCRGAVCHNTTGETSSHKRASSIKVSNKENLKPDEKRPTMCAPSSEQRRRRLKIKTSQRRLPFATCHQAALVHCLATLALISTASAAAAAVAENNLLDGLTRANSRSPQPLSQLPLSTIDWPRIRSGLWRTLVESRPSALLRQGPGGGRPTATPPSRDPARPMRPLVRAFNQIRNQIGARNTIRVHNAFRDFAWRLLSSFSMPTPVIYELRRQNFYSPDEDLANDNFYNRNTTKTIRSRRRQDADEDEPETLRERLQLRLEDLLQLSRRSLFGRVVRLPSLFPFKRQQEEEPDGEDRNDEKTSGGKQQPSTRRARLFARRARRKEPNDKQMIQINGKQYYVDDDGELKEWRGESN